MAKLGLDPASPEDAKTATPSAASSEMIRACPGLALLNAAWRALSSRPMLVGETRGASMRS